MLLAAAELLGMSLWFARARCRRSTARSGAVGGRGGVAHHHREAWASWRAPPRRRCSTWRTWCQARRLFAIAALAGAASNALVLTADALPAALAWRFVTGVCLAGVYPPAMKMIATWFRARRGLAVGTIVGALTVGKATPYLVHAIPGAGVAPVTLTASAGAVLAAALVRLGYRDGPYPFPPRPFSWGLVGRIVRERRWRLATGGYLGHMWELYAAWTWLPAFLAASVAARDPSAAAESARVASAVAFAALAVGGAGCVWGGLVADRRGREWLVTLSMAVSGLCALGIGLAFGASLWVLVPIALVWGFFVIADSAQFSVLVTESVPPHAVGTALTLQTSLGFLLTPSPSSSWPPVVDGRGLALGLRLPSPRPRARL
jgi:MFS family permease